MGVHSWLKIPNPENEQLNQARQRRILFTPMLKTETPSGRHPDLDQYATLDLVRAFTEDQVQAANVVHAAAPQIARAIDAAAPRIAAGGRLLYAGAGTSGTLYTGIWNYNHTDWYVQMVLALAAK